ncbi:GDSL-like Lipase/Acylhydrolase family protein [Paramyrothecium foliicola]|nr:GDSL-like Lipase/Acylhydrolase family protein [Paramyrothecium foliicola]
MKTSSLVSFLTSLASLACANPIVQAAKPPYLLLVGDSTVVATGGGWGDGLLRYLKDPAEGEDRARSGRTTVSWRANGRWKDLVSTIQTEKSNYEPLVTIQFGHNDQRSMTPDQYGANLKNLTLDIQGQGATPIIITSLTRRNWSDGKVREDLKDYAAKAIEIANEIGIKYLDLNLASLNYVNAIGESNANHYDLDGSDATHLSPAGGAVFGRMTLDLLLEKRKDLRPYFASNEELSKKIANGEFATGDE